ncbi:MAG: phasin family protein [Ardenticatenaceae bacterium]|nr:phasin family protein [Anaerolineales bacterium]MCB8919156.1 phasin family protein [Ardenticatenaceae bacterium]
MVDTMVVENEVVVEEEKVANPVLNVAHKTFQVGLGAMALTQSEIESLFGKLVERGETAEKDGRKMVNDLLERRRKDAGERVDEVEEQLEGSIERVLHRMNVPTKADIDNLNKKVTLLTEKVEALLQTA